MELDALVPITRVGADERTPVPQNPAEVLARLMDFSGSITLAELLQEPVPEGPSHPHADRLARKLKDKVDAYLANALPQVLRPLTGRRAPSIPTATELMSVIRAAMGLAPLDVTSSAVASSDLARTDVTYKLARPDDQVALRLSRELGAPFWSALSASLRQAQMQLTTLRSKVAIDVRELGPRAERLERIDAVLQRSIETKLTELFERFELAAELTFERACVHACAELPDGFSEHELAAWVAHDGWIERYRERCVRMTQALFGHLRRSLEGLLFAAAAAEVS
jgi:hypothetical protein